MAGHLTRSIWPKLRQDLYSPAIGCIQLIADYRSLKSLKQPTVRGSKALIVIALEISTPVTLLSGTILNVWLSPGQLDHESSDLMAALQVIPLDYWCWPDQGSWLSAPDEAPLSAVFGAFSNWFVSARWLQGCYGRGCAASGMYALVFMIFCGFCPRLLCRVYRAPWLARSPTDW